MSALTDLQSKASASVEMEYRVNLGNYEHIVIKFNLQDAAKDGEDAAGVLSRVAEVVEDLLTEKVVDVKGK